MSTVREGLLKLPREYGWHLTLTYDADGQFMASFRESHDVGYRIAYHADPAQALLDAIAGPQQNDNDDFSDLLGGP